MIVNYLLIYPWMVSVNGTPTPSCLRTVRYLIAIALEQKVKKKVGNVNVHLENSFKRQFSPCPLIYIALCHILLSVFCTGIFKRR